jgi:diguanylate cyclase (GGDEF)-like protein
VGDDGTTRVSFTQVLGNREFRALFVAGVLSMLGDNLARIAIALLIYDQTHSAFLTALSFGLSLLAFLVGGPVLSTFADRWPRRSVMINCDIYRMLIVAVVVIPGLPVALLLLLMGVVALLEPPFRSARTAMWPQVVGEGAPYAAAINVWVMAQSLCILAGYAVGGAAVQLFGARPTILFDATTFAVSAVMTRLRVRDRKAPQIAATSFKQSLFEGGRFVFGKPWLLWLVGSSSLVMATLISAEAMAIPLATSAHSSKVLAGLLTAGPVTGSFFGILFIGRLLPIRWAERLMLPLAVLTPSVLLLSAFNPPVIVELCLFVVAGVGASMSATANRVFMVGMPDAMRGRAVGLANALVSGLQGLATILVGVVADRANASSAVAVVALATLLMLIALSFWTLARRPGSRAAEAKNPPGVTDENPPNGLRTETTVPTSPGEGEQRARNANDEEPTVRAEGRSSMQRVWLFLLALTAAFVLALPLGGLHLLQEPAFVVTELPAWWIFALFLIALGLPLQFYARRSSTGVFIEAVPLVLGLFFLSPLTLIVCRVVATTILFVARRVGFTKTCFNLVSFALTSLITISIFRAFAPGAAGVHPSAWLASFASVMVDGLVSALLVAMVVEIAQGGGWARLLSAATVIELLAGTTITLLSLTITAALKYDSATAYTSTVFMVLVIGGVRTYHRLAERHAALDRLYSLARELGPLSADPADAGPALEQLRSLLHAESLELSLHSEDGTEVTVLTAEDRGQGTELRIAQMVVEAGEAADFPGVSPEGLLGRLRELQARHSRSDRIAAPLVFGDRTRGSIVARHAEVVTAGFESGDRRLLEAAASQLAAAFERGRLVSSLRWAATKDSLTGLANLDSLRTFITSTLEAGPGGVLLLLDIDRFSEINDTLGHDAGDTVLAEVGRRLESSPTAGALIGRLGSDQFAMIIPGAAGGEVARLAALAVKSRIDGSMRFANVSADIRVTIGIARAPDHGTDATTLLRRAEMAMTAAKGGSTGIGEWEPSFEQDGSRRLQLLAGLRQALADGSLEVHYQPKLRLGSGEVSGFEALVRWRHPELGPISPAEFVPLTEASGLISALTSHVLRTALSTCKSWHDIGKPVGMAVNISARSLDDPVLVGQVAAMLTASGLPPQWLTLEITESSVMENHSRAIEILRQLRMLGVRLSIDDFGTGYSSLHQLRGLPVHEVKIDRSFVESVDDGGVDRAVVRAIVDLCDSLGLTTVAEGVEKASQAVALESLGVPIVQGFFYGRPMDETAATEWLTVRQTADMAMD